MAAEVVKEEEGVSVANRPLPPAPPDVSGVSLVLFYQYIEPPLPKSIHKSVHKFVIEAAATHGVTGRGRCAPEGLNCTLTGAAPGIRRFCSALREWRSDIFQKTDFKITDGLDESILFRSLSLRKVEELVKYGLENEKAPSLTRHGGLHVEAPAFHQAMQDPESVIIDVRNHYETNVGHFQPPRGGATFLDPKMRTSTDFQAWLHAEETKKKLNNKKVLMYCTGGIRCERASALLGQMCDAENDLKVKGKVEMVQGGIERYLKTYPEGGYWKGVNYLFDKRQEQHPDLKSAAAAEEEAKGIMKSYCVVCKKAWARYRGHFKCGVATCKVPIIVCPAASCQTIGKTQPEILRCPLCLEGFVNPKQRPDLMQQKRKLGLLSENDNAMRKEQKRCDDEEKNTNRLFVGKLPLVVSATAIKKTLGPRVSAVHWIVDREKGYFYGSAFVEMVTESDAIRVLERCAEEGGIKMGKRKLKIKLSKPIPDKVWPTGEFKEYPPMGFD